MKRDRDDGIIGAEVHVGKIKISQKGSQRVACCNVASILELVDCIENDAFIDNSGTGRREPGFMFKTVSAQVMPRGRVGKYYTANRTAAAGDKSDLTAAIGAKDLLSAVGENLRA